MIDGDSGSLPGADCFIDELRPLPASMRKERLIQFFRERFSGPLGYEPEQIGPRDNLLDLGVDSLKAVEFKAMVESALSVELSSSLLFDYPNLEGLAGFCLAEAGLSESRGGLCTSELPCSFSEDEAADLLAAELLEVNSNRV